MSLLGVSDRAKNPLWAGSMVAVVLGRSTTVSVCDTAALRCVHYCLKYTCTVLRPVEARPCTI